MYCCNDCETIFRDPIVIREDPSPSGVSLMPGFYEYESCPNCGSDYITEAERCPVCGDYHKPSEVNGSELCKDCAEEIDLILQSTIEVLAERHDTDYAVLREAISERV